MAKWYYGLDVTHFGYDAGGNVCTVHTNGGGLPDNISCALTQNPKNPDIAAPAFLGLANTAWLSNKKVNVYGDYNQAKQFVEVFILEVA